MASMDASSWGDYIREYQREKTNTLPSNVFQRPTEHRERAFQQQRTSFHPILQRYTDASKEDTIRRNETKNVEGTINRSRDRQLKYIQTHDIINHHPLIQQSVQTTKTPKENRSLISGVNYNILSNEEYAQPSKQRLSESQYSQPSKQRLSESKHSTSTERNKMIPDREFDIISNRYRDKHEEKAQIDQNSAKLEAKQRWEQTHTYNTLTGQYYDSTRDRQEEIREKQAKQARQTRLEKSLPPCVRQREGAAFDVVSGVPRNLDALHELETKQARTQKRLANMNFHSSMHKERVAQRALEQDRSLNRISQERFDEQQRRGYDILNNVPYRGIDSKPTFTAHTQPKIRAIDKLKFPSSNTSGMYSHSIGTNHIPAPKSSVFQKVTPQEFATSQRRIATIQS